MANLEPKDIRFDVVFESGRWVIDDIRGRNWSIARSLSEPYWCDPHWTEPCKKGPGE